MNYLEGFLAAKRALATSREPGWVRAMCLLEVHERHQKGLIGDNRAVRTARTAANHRRKIEKRIVDLQTLSVEISPARGARGELVITVKTNDFPHPIPIRRFFNNALYRPAFHITKHPLFRLMRFVDSLISIGARVGENGETGSDLIDFYGWDKEKTVIQVQRRGEVQSGNRRGGFYLISRMENGMFMATGVSGRVARAAIRRNPDPASAVHRAEAWISKLRLNDPASGGRPSTACRDEAERGGSTNKDQAVRT